MTTASLLARERKRLKLSLEKLGRLCDISTDTLWKIESGRSGGSVDSLSKLAPKLGLRVEIDSELGAVLAEKGKRKAARK